MGKEMEIIQQASRHAYISGESFYYSTETRHHLTISHVEEVGKMNEPRILFRVLVGHDTSDYNEASQTVLISIKITIRIY